MNNPDNFDNDQQINIDPNELDQNNFVSNNDINDNNNQEGGKKIIIIHNLFLK